MVLYSSPNFVRLRLSSKDGGPGGDRAHSGSAGLQLAAWTGARVAVGWLWARLINQHGCKAVGYPAGRRGDPTCYSPRFSSLVPSTLNGCVKLQQATVAHLPVFTAGPCIEAAILRWQSGCPSVVQGYCSFVLGAGSTDCECDEGIGRAHFVF